MQDHEKNHSLCNSGSTRSSAPVQQGSTRALSANLRPGTYVIPAQRSWALDTHSTPTASSIPDWRRKAQVPTPASEADTEQTPARAAPLRPFRPMDSVRGDEPQFTAEQKVRAGFSWRYKGDITNPRNSSLGVDSEQNCALFFTNLPAGTTVKILLDALCIHAPFGRVYATSVTPETSSRRQTACAKLAMFNREEAVHIFQCVQAGNLKIARCTIAVTWNNNRLPIQVDLPNSASRVLEIHGPIEVVDIHRLTHFLEANIKFDTQDITVVREDKDERLIRWTFGSFRAQAQVARKALRTEWPGFHIRWGIDPMAVSINAIPAVQRIMPAFSEQQDLTASGEAGDNRPIGDLITFSSDEESNGGSNIYDA